MTPRSACSSTASSACAWSACARSASGWPPTACPWTWRRCSSGPVEAGDRDWPPVARARAGAGRSCGVGGGSVRLLARPGPAGLRAALRAHAVPRPRDRPRLRRRGVVRAPGRDEEGPAAGAAGRGRPRRHRDLPLRSQRRGAPPLPRDGAQPGHGHQWRLGLPWLRGDSRHAGCGAAARAPSSTRSRRGYVVRPCPKACDGGPARHPPAGEGLPGAPATTGPRAERVPGPRCSAWPASTPRRPRSSCTW